MKAEIIASGTELLLGEVTDTNTVYIASQLAELGLDLYYVSIVGDNPERFTGVLKTALERSDIVIVTGGLGPTKGDITREVIAGLLGEELAIDPALRQHIIGFFKKLNLSMPINNLKQATLIPSATAMPNPLGSAPGWWVEKNSKIIISLPGPPAEMQTMWQGEVYPRLSQKAESIIVSRTLKTWGLSEAMIDQMVGHFMSCSNPTLALYAKLDGIQLRITAKASDHASADKLISTRENELRAILKEHIWGADKETLEGIVSRLVTGKGLSIASAETFTGGLLSSALAVAPDSNKFFKGGFTVFGNARHNLTASAEQPEKASPEYAAYLAQTARERFRTDIGIGIDGWLENQSGTLTGKAFIAINFPRGNQELVQTYPAGSYQLVRRSVTHAFFSLRQILMDT
ncbi:MAG TPA: CinA family nicotinamide mononucleotide deamidase-related protein [Dehalococcoidales bacterium]|nr:CinA family nicotinamide mononucleotide deamidase-related protein [Dehalococcoidales bacterium]